MIRRIFTLFMVIGSFAALAQAPTATISVISPTVCTDQSFIANSVTTNTPTVYKWNILPVNGTVLSATDQPSVGVSISKPGVYTLSLTVSNTSGTFTTTRSMTVSQSPTAAFSASLTNVGFPNQLNLTNYSSNATNYIWSYSETAATDTSTNATHTYSASGSYSMMLIASTTAGCSDTASYSFYISDSSGITLPNIFTPNLDKVNDVFKPVARGISSMKVWIYSRWGNFIYGWDTVNGSWDGHTGSGEQCEEGVYFCVLEASGFDGKNYKLKTTVTLMR